MLQDRFSWSVVSARLLIKSDSSRASTMMSANGPKRTCASALHISAFGSKADIDGLQLVVADVGAVSKLVRECVISIADPQSRMERRSAGYVAATPVGATTTGLRWTTRY